MLLELGECDAAIQEIRQAAKNRGRNAPGELAYVLGRAGHTAEASRLLAEQSTSGGDDLIDPYQRVLAHLGVEEYDKAFAWLDRALEHRSRDLVLLGVSPIADPIRSSARFEDFVQRASLPKVARA